MNAATIRAVLLAAIAAACAPAGAPEDPDSPTPVKLPLTRTLAYTAEEQRGGNTISTHIAVFGNWAAECVWSRGARPAVSWCDVYPWNGAAPKRASAIIPYTDRATVQYFVDKPAKIVVKTSARAAGTELSYYCGGVAWKGPENGGRLKFFYDDEAQRFLSQMKYTDCAIAYTPRGGSAPVEVKRIAHGFAAANQYAESFSRYPKPIS